MDLVISRVAAPRTPRPWKEPAMSHIRRLFVEKQPAYAVEARHILHDLRDIVGITALEHVRLAVRYDVQDLADADLEAARWTVFAEPPVDEVFEETLPVAESEVAIAVEYLPGQYDQRADSAAQCLQLLTHGKRPVVACARVYVFKGALSEAQIAQIRGYLINPVDSREAASAKPTTLSPVLPEPEPVPVLDGFTTADAEGFLAQGLVVGVGAGDGGREGRLVHGDLGQLGDCLLYTSPSPRDGLLSRMPSSA